MINVNGIQFDKCDGLIPVCVQDHKTLQVLMVGFMNREALEKTIDNMCVTFFSRTRQSLWTKGETSGHLLRVKECFVDCDQDTLLIFAEALGPTCHEGSVSCFKSSQRTALSGLFNLLDTIDQRVQNPCLESYTCTLLNEGTQRIAQKVGEEAIEVALAAVSQDKAALKNEAADLLFHLCVLLKDQNITLEEVCDCL